MEDQYEIHNISQESGEATENDATFNMGGSELPLHINELEDVGHPLVPEVKHEYLAQEINGVTDVELLSYVVNDPDFYALLEGEAGVGKNMSINVVANAANYPVVRMNMGLGSTYESLVGRYAPADNESTENETYNRSDVVDKVSSRLESEGVSPERAVNMASNSLPSGSSFEWVDGLLTRAVKNGWMFVADEINAAPPESIMPMNGLTESRSERYLTIEERGEVINPHPRFRFVATRNPVTYAGTSEQNSALESRGYIIQYDYHEEMALKEILKNRSNIVENESEEALSQFVQLVNDIRRQEQSGQEIMTKIASRDCIKACRLTDIMPMREAAKSVLLGVADPTDEMAIEEMIETTRF